MSEGRYFNHDGIKGKDVFHKVVTTEFYDLGDDFFTIHIPYLWPWDVDTQNRLYEYILENSKTPQTKILFESPWEGHIISPVNEIHNLIERFNLDPKRIYYSSCGLDANLLYDEICISRGIAKENQINIISINVWEWIARSSAFGLPEPIFVVENKEKNFLCFNRMNRAHRTALIGLLLDADLVDSAFYSFYKEPYGGNVQPVLNSNIPHLLSPDTANIIKSRFLEHMHRFPLILNLKGQVENINWVRKEDCVFFEKSYFSLVTETFFFKNSNEESVFFSEKMFKPILRKHPFVLLNRPFALFHLRQMGYKTFSPFINEQYDEEVDDEKRLLMIVDEVKRLCKQTPEEWLVWLENVSSIVEHNHRTIFSKRMEEYVYSVKLGNV